MDDRILYKGYYKNGKKVGKWDIYNDGNDNKNFIGFG